MCRVKTWPSRPLCAGLLAAVSAGILCCAPRAYPWGGEHQRISAAAFDALSQQEREYLAPERSALVEVYCTFPDINWPCYGQWGGGVGDPKVPRMPDTRRLWEVSFYCQWDPVLGRGKGYPHAPPASCEAAAVFFLKAADALASGRLEDGSRYLGVMLHYIQDSGSFPHVQPIHRVFSVRDPRGIQPEGCSPRSLGPTAAEAAKALSGRVFELVDWTEHRIAPLMESVNMPLARAKGLAARETMPAAVAAAVERARAEKPAEFEAVARDCAAQCVQACADALHSALCLASQPRVETPPPRPNVNLVFNPSFEQDDGDSVPDGWCVGWLDTADRLARADWYLAGTHWARRVHAGRRSVLLLWPPKKGVQWQQTWPKAVRVRPGEKYRGSVWAAGAGASGANCLVLEFSDTGYRPVLGVKSERLTGDAAWQRLSVEASVPETARWLRLLLHGEARDGAVWYDDAEIVRLP